MIPKKRNCMSSLKPIETPSTRLLDYVKQTTIINFLKKIRESETKYGNELNK